MKNNTTPNISFVVNDHTTLLRVPERSPGYLEVPEIIVSLHKCRCTKMACKSRLLSAKTKQTLRNYISIPED